MSDNLFGQPLPDPEPYKPAVESTDPGFRHSVVDSVMTPIEVLATRIGGSNWTVDYYSQVIGADEALKAFDPEQHLAYQKYHKIHKLIIKLQGALQHNDQPETGVISVTGSAIVTPIPGFIVNQYDMFIADIGEGVAGLFTINSVRKPTANKASSYLIEFTLQRPATLRYTKLIDEKVVQNSYYREDLLILGKNPLITSEQYNARFDLEEYLRKITQAWVSSNFSHTWSSLMLPDQETSIYDQYVMRAARDIIGTDEHPLMRRMYYYNCDDHRMHQYTSIYDVVIKNDPYLLHQVFKRWGVIPARRVWPSIYQMGITYSGIANIIIPLEPNKDADMNRDFLNFIGNTYTLITGKGGSSINLNNMDILNGNCKCCSDDCGTNGDGSVGDGGSNGNSNGNGNEGVGCIDSPYGKKQLTLPPFDPNYYVLSKAFYEKNRENCTLFEKLIWDMLDNKVISKEIVMGYCENYHQWTRLQQFYFGPILIALIKGASRGV